MRLSVSVFVFIAAIALPWPETAVQAEEEESPASASVLDLLPKLTPNAAFVFEGGLFGTNDKGDEVCMGPYRISARPVAIEGGTYWKLVTELELVRAVVSAANISDSGEAHFIRKENGYERVFVSHGRQTTSFGQSPTLIPAKGSVLALLGKILPAGDKTWSMSAGSLKSLEDVGEPSQLTLRAQGGKWPLRATEDVQAVEVQVNGGETHGDLLQFHGHLVYAAEDRTLLRSGSSAKGRIWIRPLRGEVGTAIPGLTPVFLGECLLQQVSREVLVGASRAYLDVDAMLDAIYGEAIASMKLSERESLRDLYIERLLTTLPEITALRGLRTARERPEVSVEKVDLEGDRGEYRLTVKGPGSEASGSLGVVVGPHLKVVDFRQGTTLLTERLREEYEAKRTTGDYGPEVHARGFLTGPDTSWGPPPDLPTR